MKAEEILRQFAKYKEDHGIGFGTLSKQIGLPKTTLRDALDPKKHKKSPSKFTMDKIRVFLSHQQDTQNTVMVMVASSLPQDQSSLVSANLSELESTINIVLARMNIASLTGIFDLLTHRGSSADRNRFREELGRNWDIFIEAIKPMFSEAAFNAHNTINRRQI